MFQRFKDKLKDAPPTPSRPIPFGWKVGWFAIRAEPDAVISALAKSSYEISWETAIERLTSHKAFVTPSFDRWTLLVTSKDAIESSLIHLSENLVTDVAYFESHRGVGGAAYGWTTDGKIVRIHSQVDGRWLENVGELTDLEKELDIEPIDFENENLEFADQEAEDTRWERNPYERHVLQLAGRLTIDPSTIDRFEPSTCTAVKLKSFE